MSKDMYDKNFKLKPEFAMTEAEKRKMIYNDKLLIQKYTNDSKSRDNTKVLMKEHLKKNLKLMQEEVFKNKISLKQFEEYYILIKSSIATGLIDDILTYALSLSDAVVLPLLDYGDDTKYLLYKKDLENIIAKNFRQNKNAQKLYLFAHFYTFLFILIIILLKS